MLTVFYRKNNDIFKTEGVECFERIPVSNILWIDLEFPSDGERSKIESLYPLNFNELERENHLESNSRVYEAENLTLISSTFLLKKEDHYESLVQAHFYVLGRLLITKREAELVSFNESVEKIMRNQKFFKKGTDVLEVILETKVDLDTDFIEQLAHDITALGRNILFKREGEREVAIENK